tara:strand:+ start:2402 stop:2602 length:201 start_codon:yes stop_codon:yes gene_type:complete
MGRLPQPVVWNGHRYPTVGWALGDALLLYPDMNDQDLAALLDVSSSRIQYWRTRAGIPTREGRKKR